MISYLIYSGTYLIFDEFFQTMVSKIGCHRQFYQLILKYYLSVYQLVLNYFFLKLQFAFELKRVDAFDQDWTELYSCSTKLLLAYDSEKKLLDTRKILFILVTGFAIAKWAIKHTNNKMEK